ncbi:DUF3885 domain-containing protein [Streptomyces sp. NPDC002285]
MSSDFDGDRLSALWQQQFPKVPPIAHELRAAYSDRWVRFHSLPRSKRYPETEEEYAIVLHRYNTLLDELERTMPIAISDVKSRREGAKEP